jgi:DNA replication protein DnaC
MEDSKRKMLDCEVVLSKIRNNALQQRQQNLIKHPFDKDTLWEWFKEGFEQIHGKPFQFTKAYMKVNYASVFNYFLNEMAFFKSPNLYSHRLAPNFKKGLLIVGKVGVGKTAIMKVFEKIFMNYKPHRFKIIETYKVVEEYESLMTPNCKKEFYRRYSIGNILFDDLNSERIANNFGKVNVMQEIIFRRHNNGYKTHFTMNPFSGFENLPEQNLLNLEGFYDARVADRLFEMCNYITISGKSKRI